MSMPGVSDAGCVLKSGLKSGNMARAIRFDEFGNGEHHDEKSESITIMKFDPSAITLDRAEILRLQGCRHMDTRRDAWIGELLQEESQKAVQFLSPQGTHRLFPIASLHGKRRIELSNGSRFDSRCVSELIRGSSLLVVALCTIGQSLENQVSEYLERGEYARAVMLDAIGSVAAESCAELLNDFIQENTGDDSLMLTERFSPGYGDFKLESQRTLFSLMDGDTLGITINDSCLMTPRKSISFVGGMGKEVRFTRGHRQDRCAVCGLINCQYSSLAR